MSVKLLDHKEKNQATHILRPLSPYGLYPESSVILDQNCGYFNSEIPFSLFKADLEREKNYYSDMQWLYDEEIYLYAAIMLARNEDQGRVLFYPCARNELYLRIENEAKLLKELKNILKAESKKWKVDKFNIGIPQKNSEYEFQEVKYDHDLIQLIFSSINRSDNLIFRGLTTLIKSNMLKFQIPFQEEGANTLYISMEASHQIILRKLKEEGVKNPTTRDAANYLHDAFGDPPKLRTLKYFEEFYEDRIMSLHPENRFGVFPYPPLSVSHFYHLHSSLCDVYRWLITGNAKFTT